MEKIYIAYGSWKYRHDEDLKAGEEMIYLLEIEKEIVEGKHSIYVDCRREFNYDTTITEDGVQTMPQKSTLTASNLNEDFMALGIIVKNDSWNITHLVTRIECDRTHLIKSPALPAKLDENNLLLSFRQLFNKEHLYLNNFECYYVKSMPDTELEQKYNVITPYNYIDINKRFYEKMDNGEIKGFAPQLGDEIELWSYDNNFFEIAPNENAVAGYVSNMFWSRKKKTSWDEPVSTYKKKLYKEDSLERWERNYHNVYISESPIDSLSEFFKLPLTPLRNFRRTRLDIACEAVETGNIFMINFEDSGIEDIRHPQGKITQCEIEYLKTRDINPDEKSIYDDFAKLSAEIEKYMEENNLEYEKTNYSKLTFLKNFEEVYVEQ